MMFAPLLLALQAVPAVAPGEDPVAPFVQADTNAGARPATDPALVAAFHGQPGIRRIVDGLVDRNMADPRIGDIFKGQDLVRLRRTLFEHLCYVVGAGCHYSGRDMKSSHKDLGIQQKDFNALVENLQAAMRAEGVPFGAQNRLLAMLAPMHRDVIVR
ncbi:MAG TPA: group 1 truncated hemoglobin [Sphingomonas sp.]|jgi:hemoglobin|uniref:group I truncated hemoglobin n=1 Tax=Sphingomonas sp. TaxID=28214 RepID=UPI002EDABAB7